MSDTAGVSGFLWRAGPETLLAAMCVLVWFVCSHLRRTGLALPTRPLARLSRRPVLAMSVVSLFPIAVRFLLLPIYPPPIPRVHDEFAFLLGADTLAHGRLANPIHPMALHFESMHILSRPTYASAFPMAQSAALAVGQIVAGRPWLGVWAGAGLFGATTLWMLRAWLPPGWALLGALLAVARFGVAGYWMNSYWGGFLAAAGGALVSGSLPRLIRRPSFGNALPAGFGLAILANTRPIEGAWMGLIVAAAWCWCRRRDAKPERAALVHLAAGLLVILVPAAIAMCVYFTRVTGKPYMPPYLLYRMTRTQAPHFVWQEPRSAPRYDNAEMAHFYLDLEMHDYREARTHPVKALVEKASDYWRFYLGPLWSLALLPLASLWRSPTRVVIVMAMVFSLVLWVEIWHNPHYAAPATCLVVLLVTTGLRHLTGRRRTRVLGHAIPTACAVLLCVQIAAGPAPASEHQSRRRWPAALSEHRNATLRRLIEKRGRHLVLVRYGPRHDPGDEWVYNSADPDSSPVVWARELDPSSNAALLQYYRDRRVWMIEPDEPNSEPIPYADATPRPMPFVALGAPGIESLRDPERIRVAVRGRAGNVDAELTCDEWNYHFTEETGVAGPDPLNGCYSAADRTERVPFDRWFQWIIRQR